MVTLTSIYEFWNPQTGYNSETGETYIYNELQTTTTYSYETTTTDPHNADSDFDGCPDGWERANGYHPNHGTDGFGDFDADGLTNGVEFALGTGMWNSDSDGDHLSDGDEVVLFQTNPLNAADPGTGSNPGTGSDPGAGNDPVTGTGAENNPLTSDWLA